MSERLFGALLLLGSAIGIWIGWDLHALVAYEPVGPRAFPLLVLSLLGVFALVLMFGRATTTAWPPRAVLVRVGLLFAVLLGYALLFERLGFVVSTTLATVPVARAFGATWRQAVVSGLALGVGLFFLFDKLLDVVLPVGAWLKPLGL